ncbi:hypothetical protein LCGC14_3079470 [marine sediment metagenome]|uniref:Uncharacterized protein n=1 Tax=marine sediment metagenome TaxID=412755 RepID=A0A0F8WEJ9_9ZZZZ
MEKKILEANNHGYQTEQGDPAVNGVGITYVTTILVEGGNNDYAAYQGIGSHQFIATRGQKLTYERAKDIFPMVEALRYRR